MEKRLVKNVASVADNLINVSDDLNVKFNKMNINLENNSVKQFSKNGSYA